jgi:hypothetical protein
MKTVKAYFDSKDSNGWVRAYQSTAFEPVSRDELVTAFDPSDEAAKFPARVRSVSPSGVLALEVYYEGEPPYKTLVVDNQGWSYQRVCLKPGGSWLSHESMNRTWREISGKVTVVCYPIPEWNRNERTTN